MKQVWKVALYLEGRQFINSLRRSLENPVGLLGTAIALLAVLAGGWFYLQYQFYRRPFQPAEAMWVGASSQERLLSLLLFIMMVALGHLLLVLVRLGFNPYRFIHKFSESDLQFLFATPLSSWRLIRTLLFVRATASLGITLPLSLGIGLLIAIIFFPVLARDYLQQLRTGAWLLLGYFALRYVQGLFFELLVFYCALVKRRKPWLGWAMLIAGCLWLTLLIFAMVLGAFRAGAQGANHIAMFKYALNWLPTLLLSLPARATADAVLAVYTGWTSTMGVMFTLWIVGILWLAKYLTRHSAEIVDMVAIGVQLGAGKQADESDTPLAVRKLLEHYQRESIVEFHTPTLLQRWQPRGIGALLWRDMVINLRTMPAWFMGVLWLGWTGIVLLIPSFGKYAGNQPLDGRIAIFAVQAFVFFFVFMVILNPELRDFSSHFDEIRGLPFSAEQFILYHLASVAGMIGVFFLVPACLAGLIIYPEAWYLSLASLLLTLSYTASLALLALIYELLTAQPYLNPVVKVIGAIRSMGLLTIALAGFAIFGFAIMLGVWFPLIALLLALLCLPMQIYLVRMAADLWRSYTPMT